MAAAKASCGIEETTTRLSSLSLDGDAERAIVQGIGTIRSDEMPFVNRHEELWQVFRVNAENMRQIKLSQNPIEDFRPLQLLFCVQYFGAGKTTLGRMFPDKIKGDEEVQQFINTKLVNNDDLKSEWEIVQDNNNGISRVLIDVRTVEDIIRKAAAVTSGDKDIHIRDPEHAADYLVEYAIGNGPTLFHFDEVGADDQHDLDKLRKLAVAVWTRMHAICCESGADAMPRIYFLVTGKSTEPFQDVGMGSHLSPCPSYFLVLDMLSATHVGDVRTHVTNDDNVSNPLVLHDLNEDYDGQFLNECLAAATGGAPRLLLYALRALHYLQPSLESRQSIESAINDDVFSALNKISTVSREFYPGSRDSSELACFRMLLGIFIRQHHLQHDTQIAMGRASMTIGRMLRFQTFFLSRDDSAPGEFTLRLPLFHRKAADAKFGRDPLPMLLIAMAGAKVNVNEPWRIFEMLPAHIVACQAAFRLSTMQGDAITWAAALPSLFRGSSIAKVTTFDLGREPFSIHLEKRPLPLAIERDAEKYAKLAGAVLPVDKSHSADLFHVQRDGSGQHVAIEWQQKFDVATALQMATVRDEVTKCNATLPTILIVFASTVGPVLLSLIQSRDDRVLVLSSWSQDKAAEYVFGSGKTLLWRQEASSKWFFFPSATRTFHGTIQDDAAVVCVRPRLEVIIPHHDVVRRLIGPARFDTLVGAAASSATVDSTSAMLTTLDDVFGGETEEQQQEQKYDERAGNEAKLKEAEVKLEKAEAKLKEAKAGGDQDDIARAKEGAATAQKMVTYLTNVIIGTNE